MSAHHSSGGWSAASGGALDPEVVVRAGGRAAAGRRADRLLSRNGSTTSVSVSVSSWSVAASARSRPGRRVLRDDPAEHLAVEVVEALVVDALKVQRRAGGLNGDRRSP